MAKINVLSPDVYNLISAGEVVEKPYGAVKELVENSIDAGATRIVIEVANGGFDVISVTDNGCGIREEDVELAFVKHATSKLFYADDLYAVQTLGFRGEALSSISAVSRVKLTTRTYDSETGVCVLIEDGVVKDKQYVPANIGTKIEVRDLFYNTPARKKFFKSPAHESAEITKFVARLILTNYNLDISYILDGKQIYSTKGEGLQEAIFAVYGSECLQNCLKIAYCRDGLRIEGYVGSPEYTKANKNYQTLSVNGRCIYDQGISASIMQAYKPYLMVRKFPFYVLNLDIPCDKVDVNVHPKKSEVRFADSRKVCSAFYHAVEDVLVQFVNDRIDQTFNPPEEPPARTYTPEEFKAVFNDLANSGELEMMNREQLKDVEAIEEATLVAERQQSLSELADRLEREVTVEKARKNMGIDANSQVEQRAYITIPPTPKPLIVTKSEEDELFDRARILGVAFKTYLILEIDDKVIFVDQHAAHERILFDKFMQQRTSDMQPVLIPYVFTVSDEEALFLEENKDNILSAGIELEPFGHNTYRIIAVSTLLSDIKMDEFVSYLLSGMEDFKLDDRTLIVETLAKKACKAAVKAGYTLNEYEIKYILKQVCDNKILQCPHGRPITVIFEKSQIEKMFKRIV